MKFLTKQLNSLGNYSVLYPLLYTFYRIQYGVQVHGLLFQVKIPLNQRTCSLANCKCVYDVEYGAESVEYICSNLLLHVSFCLAKRAM